MNDFLDIKGIWFVYDGECPMCQSAADAIKIKKRYGELHLMNARTMDDNNFLMKEINHRGFDLDEGMVIYVDNKFYHGKDALKLMAQYGDAKNAFTIFCKSFFWSDTISSLTYPWMKAMRNWLLRKRNIGPINNLNLRK